MYNVWESINVNFVLKFIFWFLPFIYFWQPKLVAVSNKVSFINPNAPVYPRLAQGKTWDEVSLSSLYIVISNCIFFFQLWISFSWNISAARFLLIAAWNISFQLYLSVNARLYMRIKNILDYQNIIYYILLTDYCDLDKRIWYQWSWAFCWMGTERRKPCEISCWDIDFWSQHLVWYETLLSPFSGDFHLYFELRKKVIFGWQIMLILITEFYAKNIILAFLKYGLVISNFIHKMKGI